MAEFAGMRRQLLFYAPYFPAEYGFLFSFGTHSAELQRPAQPMKHNHRMTYKTQAASAPAAHHADMPRQACSASSRAAGSSPVRLISTPKKAHRKKWLLCFALHICTSSLSETENNPHIVQGVVGIDITAGDAVNLLADKLTVPIGADGIEQTGLALHQLFITGVYKLHAALQRRLNLINLTQYRVAGLDRVIAGLFFVDGEIVQARNEIHGTVLQ